MQTATDNTASPHTRPTVASVVGVLIGIGVIVVGHHGTGAGHSTQQTVGTLAGSGMTLGTVLAYLASHLGITKATQAKLVAEADKLAAEAAKAWPEYKPQIEEAIGMVPGLHQEIAAAKADAISEANRLIAALPQSAQIDVRAILDQARQEALEAWMKATGQNLGLPTPVSGSGAPPAAS